VTIIITIIAMITMIMPMMIIAASTVEWSRVLLE
jgi:hypothetical protein